MSACPCCRTIRDILKPMMKQAKADSVVAVFNRLTIDRVYGAAVKGAATKRKSARSHGGQR